MSQEMTKTYQQLKKQMKIGNILAVPKITKVLVHAGVGKNRDDKKYIEAVVNDLMLITGQKPQERRAKKAVAGFKVREGNLVGYLVTLRGKRMEEFVTRFVDTALPRVRDFRGIAVSSLDDKGNLNVGMTEQLPFPEINSEKTDVVFGVQVTLVTGADSFEEGEKLFRALGFPLKEEDEEEN